MAPSMACLSGAALGRIPEHGLPVSADLGRRETPFGSSDPIYLIDDPAAPYYVLASCDDQGRQVCPGRINHRANFYALKDLGVRHVLGVSAAGSITHNFGVGDVVLVSDLIDLATSRPQSFFEHCGAGVLRQFPVFCPSMRQAMSECLEEIGCDWHAESTLVVTEGPRLETAAEVRWFAAAGGELVGHHFAPEAFLAKELQMCFAGVAYVANYAETGSNYRPFSARDLFGGLTNASEEQHIAKCLQTICELIARTSRRLADSPPPCQCDQTMRHNAEKFGLGPDWRQWFADTTEPARYQSVPMPTATLGRQIPTATELPS